MRRAGHHCRASSSPICPPGPPASSSYVVVGLSLPDAQACQKPDSCSMAWCSASSGVVVTLTTRQLVISHEKRTKQPACSHTHPGVPGTQQHPLTGQVITRAQVCGTSTSAKKWLGDGQHVFDLLPPVAAINAT